MPLPTLLLAMLVLLPAAPGMRAVARALSHKDRGEARRAIRWAAVTALIAIAIVVVTYIRLFGAVAAADPSLKAGILAAGLRPVQPVVRMGVGLAAVIGFLGGVARGLAPQSNDERRR